MQQPYLPAWEKIIFRHDFGVSEPLDSPESLHNSAGSRTTDQWPQLHQVIIVSRLCRSRSKQIDTHLQESDRRRRRRGVRSQDDHCLDEGLQEG